MLPTGLLREEGRILLREEERILLVEEERRLLRDEVRIDDDWIRIRLS